MMAKIQRFGGAMFTPVLFFVFSGLIVSIFGVLNNPAIVGSIATDGTTYHGIMKVVENGGWTVFNNMDILFAVGLPLGLANKARGRAALEAFLLYMTFQTFLSTLLENFGKIVKIDFASEVGDTGKGLTMIGGIKTLDTGVLGAIVIAAIIVYLHNKFFDVRLPDWLGIFQGSALVAVIGFVVMFALAIVTFFVWPILQNGINDMQHFMVKSGDFGVFIYIFLEKALLPTGLHHFIYAPFQFGPAVVEGGTTLYWYDHLQQFAASHQTLKSLFPAGGFALQGLSNFFGVPGIALAFWSTTKKENRKKLAVLIIPGVITSVFAGITEPFDYTFLFIAPVLFFVHAGLAAIFATISYALGTVGNMGGGLIEITTSNFIPLWANHYMTYIVMFVVGAFSLLTYFLVFRFLILKFNFQTPGRAEGEVQMFHKEDYKAKKAAKKSNGDSASDSQYDEQAIGLIEAFGGVENIDTITNCATRLRVSVFDEAKVLSDADFKNYQALGVVRNGKAFQVIIGLYVPNLREVFEKIVKG
ncbi:MAG: alpha-glucoside-specific PTS transporter subunit IIBC [Streptococcaceae bacterium]|jgi:PTS system arbutin-like IIC component|nr:alpha-glucoside-specific PTS transporter subunit IIBC [Streptococcaceae bacterium]